MRGDNSILNNSNGNNDDADIIATTGPETETESEVQPEASLKGEHYLIELRRARVAELWAQGLSQQRIASDLHVSQQLISTDIKWLKQQAREQIHSFVTEKLPVTVAKTFVSLDLVTTKLWATVSQAERDGDNKIKLQALSQINQVEAQKIEIVSNLGIVDSVVGAAEQRQAQPSLPNDREGKGSLQMEGTLTPQPEESEENVLEDNPLSQKNYLAQEE